MSKNCKNQQSSGRISESNSGKLSFEERSRNVFSSIDEAEKLTPESSLYQKQLSTSNNSMHVSTRVNSDETEAFRNRESIFKLSDREESGWPPSNRFKSNAGQWERGRDQDSDFGRKPNRQAFKRPFNRQKIPDHAKNPSKYTKYSLSDAPNVSNQSNTQTALAFLKELSDRKEKMQDVADP